MMDMYPDFDYTYADTIKSTPFYDPFFNPESSYTGSAFQPKFAEPEQHYGVLPILGGIIGGVAAKEAGWEPGMMIAEGRKTMMYVVFGVIGLIVLIAVLIAIMTFLKK